jgi:hypothetical protein
MILIKRLIAIGISAFISTFAIARLHGDGNTSYAARGVQTQAVYYRDASFDQPLIGAKMALGFDKQPFWRIYIQLSPKTDPSILSHFKLYKTSVDYFAPARATELTRGGVVKRSSNGRTICFDLWNNGAGAHPEIAKCDTLWVTARVSKNAPAGAEIVICG